MIVSVAPEVERELIDAAIFYAEQANVELGLAFIAELSARSPSLSSTQISERLGAL